MGRDQRNGEDPRRGAVASENKICSGIGTGLLEAGGNAVDAVGVFIDLGSGRGGWMDWRLVGKVS